MNTRHVNTHLVLLPALLFCLAATLASAQGFVRQYPLFTATEGGSQSVFPQADGNFRLAAIGYPLDITPPIVLQWLTTSADGALLQTDTLLQNWNALPYNYKGGYYLQEDGGFLKTFADSNRAIVQRFDETGAMQWENIHAFQTDMDAEVLTVVANAAGESFLRGFLWSVDSPYVSSGYMLKLDPAGALLWEQSYNSDITYVFPTSVLPTPDGGCAFNAYSWSYPNDTVNAEKILRMDGAGNLIWQYAPLNGRLFPAFSGKVFDVNGAGQTLLFTKEINNLNGLNPLRLDILSPGGALVNQLNLDDLLDIQNSQGQLIFATADGGAVLVVQKYLLNSWTNYAAKIAPDGTLAWKRPLSFMTDAFPANFSDGKELPDGSLVLYGYQGNDLLFIKLSPDGVIYPHTLTGRIVRDTTYNCLDDPFDPPFEGWVVTATGNGLTQFASSNASGQYTITDLDTGACQITLTLPSYLWQACADTVQLQFNGTAPPQTDTLDFQVQALYDCPLMQVDIGVPFLRRCFDNVYSVQYCNNGNQTAANASVTVNLDPMLELTGANIPYTQSGQSVAFDLGAVAAGDCGSFHFTAKVDCAVQIGQTLCATAHITPDTICALNLPGWSGARIEVSAHCAGDSVQFRIQNTGSAPMTQALDFIIVDDHVITRQGNFLLAPGGIREESVAADGSTWRIIAGQEPGFPFGPQMPSAGVEACTATLPPGFSTGMLNMFSNYSGNPFESTDCHTVVGSWDPNDKQAFPAGVDAPHYIEPNQPVAYQIRFQNTGNDTAFTVVIRDTLSPWLDPGRIRPGAASHPYRWRLSGNGILTLVFPGIALPDSNVNPAASQGFVQFSIAQQRDNPPGTLVENRAGIYFDFNDAVLTNTVFHTIEKDFLLAAGPGPQPPLPRLRVWPAPATESALVDLSGLLRPGRRLKIRDALGRLRQDVPASVPLQALRREGLPAGMYWLELSDENRVVAAGRVIWMD